MNEVDSFPDRLCIKPAGPEDIEDLLKIERLCFDTTWSRDQFMRDLLHNPVAYYFMARQDRDVVGHAGMYVIEEEAHIITVAVLPACRRQGIGVHLMLHLIEVSRTRKAIRMTLEVRVSNHGARALYEKLGFHDVAIRRGYYKETGEDALIMWIPNLEAPWLPAMWEKARR